MTKSIFIAAVERSGDDLGAALTRQLRHLEPSLDIQGVGGAAMAAHGVSSNIDISKLSVLGFTEGLKAYPEVLRRVRETVNVIMIRRYDAVVLIDSWGFMLRVAWGLKKAGFTGKIIKYVAPQVFAMREGRAKVLAKAVDHLMTIHSFDAHYFERHGLPVTYVGNPMFDADLTNGNKNSFLKRHNIAPDAPVIAILFGSRTSEIQRLSGPFAGAVKALRTELPHAVFVSPVSQSVAADIKKAAAEDKRLEAVIFLPEDEKADVFAAASAAIACSGTVTTQLATAGVPTVVAYKLSGLTYFFAKRLFKQDYISLVNIAAKAELMPEFVQNDCESFKLSQAVLGFLRDEKKAAETSRALQAQTDAMRGEGGLASVKAAKTVLSLVSG